MSARGRHIVICCIYHPGKSSAGWSDMFYCLANSIDTDSAACVISSDFNIDHLEDNTSAIELYNIFGFKQQVTEPT